MDELYKIHSPTRITISPEAKEIMKMTVGMSLNEWAKYLLQQGASRPRTAPDYAEPQPDPYLPGISRS